MASSQQHFSDTLRTLRQKSGLTREGLAELAHISSRTLQNWETGRSSPRRVELDAVLSALDISVAERASLLASLQTNRGFQMTDELARTDDALPNLGDLLRALRNRRGWLQEQVADALGVSRITVNRWESNSNLPGDENMMRLCDLLGAHPDERAALLARRLAPPHWKPHLSWDECLEQIDALKHIPRTSSVGKWNFPLMDMIYLSLKRQMRLQLAHVPEAWHPMVWKKLSRLELDHANWLDENERGRESRPLALRSLQILDALGGPLPEDPYYCGLLNLVAGQYQGPKGLRASFDLNHAWLPRLPGIFRCIPLCDMALSAFGMKRFNEMERCLAGARHALQTEPAANPDHLGYYRATYATILRRSGKPVEAMEWLRPVTDKTHFSLLFTWAEVSLEAGDKRTADSYLSVVESQMNFVSIQKRRQWEQIVRRL